MTALARVCNADKWPKDCPSCKSSDRQCSRVFTSNYSSLYWRSRACAEVDGRSPFLDPLEALVQAPPPQSHQVCDDHGWRPATLRRLGTLLPPVKADDRGRTHKLSHLDVPVMQCTSTLVSGCLAESAQDRRIAHVPYQPRPARVGPQAALLKAQMAHRGSSRIPGSRRGRSWRYGR